MDTAYATVSYPETAPSQLRILDSCEYLFQKSDKNEMFFGVMPSGLEATLRITEIDFPNCEVRALVKQKNDGTKNDITDPEPLLNGADLTNAVLCADRICFKYHSRLIFAQFAALDMIGIISEIDLRSMINSSSHCSFFFIPETLQ